MPSARGRTHEGSGIGLALVYELARLHHGEVRVDSALGQGSCFTVVIPLGQAHLPSDRMAVTPTRFSLAQGATAFVEEALGWLPEASGAEERPAKPAQDQVARVGDPAAGPRPCIVLADDNTDMRDYVRRLLQPLYDVIAVADGQHALRATMEHLPDLVVTDVMMPDLDGFALLQALRGDPRTAVIPVIMLSARAGEEARVEGLAAGADDYLIKPFSARELLARVVGTLALSRIRREVNEALRDSEERFRHMADNAPVMVWVTAPDGSCSFISRSWFEFTGQMPDTALGFGWVDVVHPDDREYARATFVAANEKQAPFRLEYPHPG